MGRKGITGRRNPRTILNKGGGIYPPCFESAYHYQHWRYLLRGSNDHPGSGYCLDCTPEYKVEMMAQNKCAHPETVFIVRRHSADPEQVEAIGVSSESVFWARVIRGESVIDGADYEKDQRQS